MTKKASIQIDGIPENCMKCGKRSLEFKGDSLVCIYDGWTFYLSEEALEQIRIESEGKNHGIS